MKTRAITKYLFKKQIVLLGEMYLIAFAAIYILPLLLSLISGTLSQYSFLNILRTSPISGFFNFFMFVISMLSYENFKMLIQNGISRKTFFEAQITVYGIFILIGNTINLLYNYLVFLPMTHRSTFNVFMALYQKYFDNGFEVLIFNFIFSACTLITTTLVGMMIGSFLSLFSKAWQRILLIGVPIIGAVTLIYMANVVVQHHLAVTWVAVVVKFMIGEGDSQILNPFPPLIFMVIFSLIMLAITRYLFSKKQLKRE